MLPTELEKIGPIPKEVIKKFNTLHEILKEDYKLEDGSKAFCDFIALDLASSLFYAGMKPSLIEIENNSNETSKSPNPITPQIFNGRKVWYRHSVCINDGIVFDPMLEKPIPIDDYMSTAFNEPVTFVEIASPLQIAEFFEG